MSSERRYDPRTLRALIAHLVGGGSTKTYLRTHPRVSEQQIAAIFVDLRRAVDRCANEARSRETDR